MSGILKSKGKVGNIKKKPKEKLIDDGFENGVTMMMESRIKQTLESCIVI
jgi:hypothetical protein